MNLDSWLKQQTEHRSPISFPLETPLNYVCVYVYKIINIVRHFCFKTETTKWGGGEQAKRKLQLTFGNWQLDRCIEK